MRPLVGAILAVAVLLAAHSAPAAAQSLCGDNQSIVDRLRSEYGEHLTAWGVAGDSGLIQIYTASRGKTWTILIVHPGGPTCLVAAGEDWEDIPLSIEIRPRGKGT